MQKDNFRDFFGYKNSIYMFVRWGHLIFFCSFNLLHKDKGFFGPEICYHNIHWRWYFWTYNTKYSSWIPLFRSCHSWVDQQKLRNLISQFTSEWFREFLCRCSDWPIWIANFILFTIPGTFQSYSPRNL